MNTNQLNINAMKKIKGHIMAVLGLIGVTISPYYAGQLIIGGNDVLACWASGIGFYVVVLFLVLVYMFIYRVFKD